MSDGPRLDTGRLARLLALIAVVTAVLVFSAAVRFSSERLLSIAVVAIGSIALVTAITAFMIAAVSALEIDPASE